MKLDVNVTYSRASEYEYETYLERIKLDEERISDIVNDKGFIVGPPHGIKKDIKDPNGLFSSKFGQTLKDTNPSADRYKCECGHLRRRISNRTICPICNTRVKYVDDDFGYFGWMVLKDHYIIHPNLFKALEKFIGTKVLENILIQAENCDIDGNPDGTPVEKGEPFFGYGMIKFREEFDTILAHYSRSFSNESKKDYYEDIVKNKDKIFIQSIPVFSLLLRPINVDQTNFYYEDNNGLYNIMNKLVKEINTDNTAFSRKMKPKNTLLLNLQTKYNVLYTNIEKILEGKKGTVRSLLSARYNFTSRCVIIPDPSLRIDQVVLPFECLCELLEPRIINILVKSYNLNYHDASIKILEANVHDGEWRNIIKNIINNIIKNGHKDGKGIPIIINRNPTIAYGGILQMYCVGMSDNYAMSIPLQILRLLAADFDGDVLNIMLIINEAFYDRANLVFNPRNAMFVSRNDGKFNSAVNHQRDVLVNMNTMIKLSRPYYSQQDLENIRIIKEKNKLLL